MGPIVVPTCRERVLKVWKQKHPHEATYKKLVKCCLEGRDYETAKKICEIVAKESNHRVSIMAIMKDHDTCLLSSEQLMHIIKSESGITLREGDSMLELTS